MLIALGIISLAYIFRWLQNVRNDRKAELFHRLKVSCLCWGRECWVLSRIFSTHWASVRLRRRRWPFKLLRMARDEHIPVIFAPGLTLPALAQAFIFMTVVKVDLMLSC